ncbi:MAG: hypothetical protein GEV05_15305 [Betaproteobacteria bacterium]|nr:hypothetical protein [Betaproteobacteria bacterium]
MATNAETVVVITDANVLINLLRIGQLPLLGKLDVYRFLVPEEVVGEITNQAQQDTLAAAIAAGHLGQIVVDTIEALALFAELRDVMGRGEAACLALAATTGCYIASDEKKRFRRRAIELIGEARILRTESILLEATPARGREPTHAAFLWRTRTIYGGTMRTAVTREKSAWFFSLESCARR